MPVQDVTLYGKPGCHLCEDTLALLHTTARSLGLDLQVSEVDVTADPVLDEEYGERIPILWIDGGPTLYAPINPAQLHAGLMAGARMQA